MTKLAANFRNTMKILNKRIENAALEWVNQTNVEVERGTPLDTQELRDSRYVVVERPFRSTIIEIGFKAPHAPFVHEWPSTINWTTPGTGNKFLERPYFSRAQTLPGFIKSKVRL